MMANKKDDNENQEHHEDHEGDHAEFEEEFEFDSEPPEDALAPEELEEEEEQEHEDDDDHEKEETRSSPKNMMLPIIIILAVFGFIAWKLYGMFLAPKNNLETPVSSTANQIPNESPTSLNQTPGEMPNQMRAPTTAATPAESPQRVLSIPNSPAAPASEASSLPQVTAHPTTAQNKGITGVTSAPTEQVIPQSNIPTWEETPKAPTIMPNTASTSGVLGAPNSPATTTTTTTPVIEKPVTAVSDEALAKLQKKIDDEQNINKQHFQILEKDLSQALQNANAANRGMATLQHDIASLSAAVQELTAEFKAMRSEQDKLLQAQVAAKTAAAQKKQTVTHHASKKAGNPSYSVYAIIPGRAWLRQPNGKTITVSEGDSIGEYGKILKIDAGNGVVITTSGVTLR